MFYSGPGEGGKRRRSSLAHLTELLKDWGIRDKDKLRSNTIDKGIFFLSFMISPNKKVRFHLHEDNLIILLESLLNEKIII